MSNLTEKLREWRKDRNITTPNTKVYIENVLEELLEIVYSDKKFIELYKNMIMEYYFFDKLLEDLDEKNTLDAILDISVFSTNEAELMGYDMDKAMNEVVKEISSRVQDPIQKEEWSKSGAVGKWQKSERDEHKKLWYKADFDKAKI
jgi:hypothetical protein